VRLVAVKAPKLEDTRKDSNLVPTLNEAPLGGGYVQFSSGTGVGLAPTPPCKKWGLKKLQKTLGGRWEMKNSSPTFQPLHLPAEETRRTALRLADSNMSSSLLAPNNARVMARSRLHLSASRVARFKSSSLNPNFHDSRCFRL
jgi:hypothetical protein